MRTRRVFMPGALLALMLLPVAKAADLSGKWKGELNGPDGNPLEINFDFKVAGEKLSGTVANVYGRRPSPTVWSKAMTLPS